MVLMRDWRLLKWSVILLTLVGMGPEGEMWLGSGGDILLDVVTVSLDKD